MKIAALIVFKAVFEIRIELSEILSLELALPQKASSMI
jgi:hypothetical protein